MVSIYNIFAFRLVLFLFVLFVNSAFSFYVIAQNDNSLQDSLRGNKIIKEVTINQKIDRKTLMRQPFSVEVIETEKYANYNVNLNRLLSLSPGIRVQENGGFGSESAVTIHGLSGRSVRFFLDGVPMDYMGAAFDLANFPANTVERIEVYKGVVPVQLGGDVLGGAINIITKNQYNPYTALSYSAGSFGTHRASLSGRINLKNNFIIQGNIFFNKTDNNYKVWGRGVEIAGSDGRPIEGFTAKRFNDDYQSHLAKIQIGWVNRSWADRLLIGVHISGVDKGIQHGRNMAYVYGKVRYDEKGFMPNLQYNKTGLFANRLDIQLYGMYSNVRGTTLDTGSNKYNWAGQVIASPVNGELGGIYAQKSIYKFRDQAYLWRANATYRITEYTRLRLALNGQFFSRTATDRVAEASWTLPLREPQKINKSYLGIAYEFEHDRFFHIISGKAYYSDASSYAYDYQGGAQRVIFEVRDNQWNWGASYAGRYQAGEHLLFKVSAERTLRIPETLEFFGDGVNILNAPGLRPEKSMNINLGGQYEWAWNEKNSLSVQTNLFFRNTKDLIWLGEGDYRATARYENIKKTRTKGAELSLIYTSGQLLTLSGNFTYQDVRNRQKYTSTGALTLNYNTRMHNIPTHLANAEVRLRAIGGWIKKDAASMYLSTRYVPSYYLWSPSIGTPSEKEKIPKQFTQDVGISYRLLLPLTVAVDCQNIFNKQVYDSFLLQKPGRFMSVKLNYQIHKK